MPKMFYVIRFSVSFPPKLAILASFIYLQNHSKWQEENANQNVYDILNCNSTSCYHGNIRPALSVSSNQEVAFLKLQSTKTKCLFILGQHDLQTTTFYTFKHWTTLFIHLSKIFLRFFLPILTQSHVESGEEQTAEWLHLDAFHYSSSFC